MSTLSPAFETAAKTWKAIGAKSLAAAAFSDLCAVGDAIVRLNAVEPEQPEETEAEWVARVLLGGALRTLEQDIRSHLDRQPS